MEPKTNRTPEILSAKEVQQVDKAKSLARRNGQEVQVGKHSRIVYRVSNAQINRMIRFREAESVILRLCSHRDRNGAMSGDAKRAQMLITLLSDTFNV